MQNSQEADFPVWKYDQGRSLGRGGFGSVDRFTIKEPDDTLPEEVAIKTFYDRGSTKYIDREIYMSDKCNHPSLVKTFGLCQVDSKLGLVMEVCQMDLATHLESEGGKLLLNDCKTIIQQVASGLDYLHKIDTVHHDLKPQNILLRNVAHCEIAITDFGLAKQIEHTFETGLTRVDSLLYSPPEVLRRELLLPLGHPMDIFSFGVIGFEIVIGEAPPVASNEEEHARWVLEHKIHFPEHLFDFLQKCVSWKPEDRIRKEKLSQHHFMRQVSMIVMQ